jgi:glycogen operon protein
MKVPEGKVTILNLLLNPGDQPHDFRLPPPHLPSRVLLDSAQPAAHARSVAGDQIAVAAHSAVLLYSEHAG